MIESTPRAVPQPEPGATDITIVTGDLTAQQIAAVTAVAQTAFAGAGASSAGSDTASRVDSSGWEKSRRDLRTPIHPSPGEWRRHT